jgi:TolB protein
VRFVVASVVVVGIVIAVLAFPRNEAPLAPPIALSEQRVVYVTDDFAIITKRGDGTGRDRIVGGSVATGGVQAQPLAQQVATYTWPTWSPDGAQLVVSRVPGPGRASAALMLMKPPSRIESAIHTTRRGGLDRVADGAPHFPLWSPDGERLALIAPDRQSTTLLLTEETLNGDVGDVIAGGAPLYIAWSPDSKLLAIHHQQTLIIRDADGQRFDTGRPSVRYRVPSFSADNASLAYVADIDDDGVSHVIARDLRTGEERAFSEVPTEAVFAWSPTNAHQLAIAQREDISTVGYRGLSVLDTETGDERVLYEGDVFAFWWSPDGAKLAVVVSGADGFAWFAIDVAEKAVANIAEFIPAPDFLTYLQFFDQFARSHQVWSADSTAVVFAGQMVVDRVADRVDRAWVVDLTGGGNHVPLGNARSAFFVPPEID